MAKPSYVRWLNETSGRPRPTKPKSTQAPSGRKKFKHDRQVRAKCRLLCKAGVSEEALVREFGGIASTMARVIKNDYVVKDIERDDIGIACQDRIFQARLDHLRAQGFDNPNRHQPGHRHKRAKQTRVKAEPDAEGDWENPIVIGSESPEPIHAVTEATPPPAHDDIDFLLAFLVRISLQKLYTPLTDIGVDEDGLRRMARYEEERLDAFMVKLAKLVPQMTPFDRITLAEEIRRLDEGAFVVD
ncbi:hypothetical protein FB451DRAFT_1550795 [Mycena latifolia]|nr:hypothetical protein FB451DRAFT_1550795 [Mycena latifolia]